MLFFFGTLSIDIPINDSYFYWNLTYEASTMLFFSIILLYDDNFYSAHSDSSWLTKFPYTSSNYTWNKVLEKKKKLKFLPSVSDGIPVIMLRYYIGVASFS